MKPFYQHTKRTLTVGDRLCEARRSYGLSLRDISQSLLIPQYQLRFLEADQFQSIPETMYRELFLKSYATYIGLDWQAVKAQYDAQMLLSKEPEQNHFKRTPSTHWFAVTPQLLKAFFLSGTIIGCSAYLVLVGTIAVSPPSLAVWSPVQDEVSGTDRVLVKGKTQAHARLTINEEPVVIRHDGTFEQEIILSEGLNIITVGASKKYSKQHTEERRVTYRRERAYNPDHLQIRN